jgi:hypothetical protein
VLPVGGQVDLMWPEASGGLRMTANGGDLGRCWRRVGVPWISAAVA